MTDRKACRVLKHADRPYGIATADGEELATMTYQGADEEAWATLFAAAPTLLAALRDMIESRHDCREAGERMDEECPRRTAARAAIAQAEGRGLGKS